MAAFLSLGMGMVPILGGGGLERVQLFVESGVFVALAVVPYAEVLDLRGVSACHALRSASVGP